MRVAADNIRAVVDEGIRIRVPASATTISRMSAGLGATWVEEQPRHAKAKWRRRCSSGRSNSHSDEHAAFAYLSLTSMTIGDCSNWCSGTGVGRAHSSVHAYEGIVTGYLVTLQKASTEETMGAARSNRSSYYKKESVSASDTRRLMHLINGSTLVRYVRCNPRLVLRVNRASSGARGRGSGVGGQARTAHCN